MIDGACDPRIALVEKPAPIPSRRHAGLAERHAHQISVASHSRKSKRVATAIAIATRSDTRPLTSSRWKNEHR